MASRRSFAELRPAWRRRRRPRPRPRRCGLEEQMDLAEVRRALKLSQEEIAQTLRSDEARSPRSRSARTCTSARAPLIEAMGGESKMVARFADHSVEIKNFAELAERERA